MRKALLFITLILTSSTCTLASISDTLVIGYSSAPPFIIEESDQIQGISIWLWEKIAQELDIPFKYKKMEFKEIIESLEQGEIDLSINPLTITSERNRILTFTSPFFVSNSTIVIHEKGPFSKIWQILKTFFSIHFLRTLCGIIILIGIFGSLTWFFERKNNHQQFSPGPRGIWDGLWWSAVTMTTVGYGDKSPKSIGGKIVALVWMFTALMFISGLTATVASTLLMSELDSSTLNLYNFKKKKVGTIRSTSTETYLESRFFRNIVAYDNIQTGLEDVYSNNLDAFMYDEPIIKYQIAESSIASHLQILPAKFDLQLYAFAVPKKHQELESILSAEILEITESLEWSVILSEYELIQL